MNRLFICAMLLIVASCSPGQAALTQTMALLAMGLGSGTTDNHFSRFAYVPGARDKSIYMFKVDPATGNLLENGALATGANSNRIVVHPNGKFAYSDACCNSAPATNFRVLAFKIDQGNGKLIPNGSVVAPGSTTIAMDAGGHFIYSLGQNGGDQIAAFSIDQSNGTLSPISSLGTGTRYYDVVAPGHNFVYASQTPHAVYTYAVDSAGTLSLTNSQFARDERFVFETSEPDESKYYHTDAQAHLQTYRPQLLEGPFATDPKGRFLFAGTISNFSFDGNPTVPPQLSILVYSIDQTTGALTWKATVEDQPKPSGPNNLWPTAIVTDAKGKFCT